MAAQARLWWLALLGLAAELMREQQTATTQDDVNRRAKTTEDSKTYAKTTCSQASLLVSYRPLARFPNRAAREARRLCTHPFVWTSPQHLRGERVVG